MVDNYGSQSPVKEDGEIPHGVLIVLHGLTFKPFPLALDEHIRVSLWILLQVYPPRHCFHWPPSKSCLTRSWPVTRVSLVTREGRAPQPHTRHLEHGMNDDIIWNAVFGFKISKVCGWQLVMWGHNAQWMCHIQLIKSNIFYCMLIIFNEHRDRDKVKFSDSSKS